MGHMTVYLGRCDLSDINTRPFSNHSTCAVSSFDRWTLVKTEWPLIIKTSLVGEVGYIWEVSMFGMT